MAFINNIQALISHNQSLHSSESTTFNLVTSLVKQQMNILQNDKQAKHSGGSPPIDRNMTS